MMDMVNFGASAQTMTSIELLDLINAARKDAGETEIRRNDFTARCRDELDGEYYETFVVTNPNGTTSEAVRMSQDHCMLVSMRESKVVRRAVLAKLKARDAAGAPVLADKPAALLPVDLLQQTEAMKTILADEELKHLAPLLWQDIADGVQNAMRRALGTPLALPAPDEAKLRDVVEIAKAAGIDLPSNLKGAAGKYVKARVPSVETERLINGSIRKSFAYSDHAAVAAAIREYLAGKK